MKNADRIGWLWSALGVALLLAACGTPAGGISSPGSVQKPTPIATRLNPLIGTASAATAAPTVQATATTDTGTILVWWPAGLYPPEGSSAAKVLQDEIDGYRGTRTVTIRVKRADGLGGIYQTLRSGSVAAPAVMPDLAMMRRSDLVQAAGGKLIEPVDVRLLASEDLFPSALALGQVGGIQYGIAYAVEIQHAAYRTSILTAPPKTLDDLLQAKQLYLFPAGTVKGVNLTLIAQYIAAGGRLSDEKGAPALDKAPLLAVLHYYEQALAAKVADAQLLDYAVLNQYWSLFTTGKTAIVQVDSTTYLAQRGNLTGVATMPVPMPAGNPITIVDGWMWVVTTTDPDRQAKALDLLAWLLRADQQGQFLHELGVLPSKRSALDTWGDDSYAGFAAALLQQPAVPPPDMIDLNVAAAMQKAFEDVLLGRKSAETATNDALEQVSRTG